MRYAEDLQREAQQTAERSAEAPEDFWQNTAAENQHQTAREAMRALELQYDGKNDELLDQLFKVLTSDEQLITIQNP